MTSPITTAKIYVGSGLNNVKSRFPVAVDPAALRRAVEETISEFFPGATLQKATGYWRGRFEPSLVVEVWADSREGGNRRVLAEAMRAAHALVGKLDQIAVAVVSGGKVTYVDARTVGKVRHGRFSATRAG